MDEHEYEDHTSELKRSREEAERAAEHFRLKGWDVYPEKVPLAGQWGFYCVHTWTNSDGSTSKRAHSVRWNIYEQELTPIVIDAQCDADILSFLWQHAGHDGFDHFEYGDGDVGFVCYCQGDRGRSLVLRIGSEIDHLLHESTFELLWMYETEDQQSPE